MSKNEHACDEEEGPRKKRYALIDDFKIRNRPVIRIITITHLLQHALIALIHPKIISGHRGLKHIHAHLGRARHCRAVKFVVHLFSNINNEV